MVRERRMERQHEEGRRQEGGKKNVGEERKRLAK